MATWSMKAMAAAWSSMATNKNRWMMRVVEMHQ
jgi:hypothetical protein